MWLRIFLFSGLVLHKVIWEIWKRKSPNIKSAGRTEIGGMKRILKAGKVALLIFFLIQTLFLNVLPMRAPHPSVLPLGFVLFVLGLCMAIAGRVNLGNNWSDLEDSQVMRDQMLVTQGLYRYIRHPIYAGDILLIIGLQLALQSWLVILALFIGAIVIRQAIAEEKLLVNSFPEYASYCSQTKRFVPFVI